ncbi:MAG: hypothetical protein IPM53_20005 [Anaerolineaceae bacterium]|nr:hypothetical protein [Anaerolineaceae bacterium]
MNLITIIAFHPTGYELRIPVSFEELPATMRRLAARGYTPSREPILTAEGLPICPRHGVPMQQRNKQNDLWFSHKMVHPETGETMYCRGYASASSPGYDILLPLAKQANDQREETPSEPAANGSSNQVAANKPEVETTNNGRSPQLNPATIAQNDAKLHKALFGQRP